MESFSLAAQHAGAINHVHIIRLDPTTAAALRELRIIVTVAVAGWKGSPHRRPKITHPSAIPNEQLSQRATEALFRPPLLEPSVGERQRQRRISRKKNGVRVSRRLPSRGTGESTSGGKQYSLIQAPEFTEDHPYWGTLRQSQIPNMKPKTATSIENRQLCRDRTQAQIVDSRNYSTKKTEHSSQIAGGLRRRGMSTAARNRGKAREKRFGLADPLVWDAINRSLVQQRQLSTLVIPEEEAVEHFQSSEIPSRTSSQRKALNRFTRQLEKYADAAGAAGKAPVMTPTDSDSKMSYHTVQPLLPYQKEFQAAGLAVTSAEQSRRPLIKHRSNEKLISSSAKYVEASVQVDGEFDGQDDALSEQSGSSSGSYVEFTPAGNPIEALPSPKSKPKRRGSILPWLRKKSPARESYSSSRVKPQYTRQPTKDNQVSHRVKTIDSQQARHNHSSLSPGTRPSGLRRAAASKPIASPTRREPSGRKLSWVGVKRGDHARYSGSMAPRAVPEPGTMQPLAHTGLRKRDVAMARLPLPETIEEEKETLPTRVHQEKIRVYPRPETIREGKETSPTRVHQEEIRIYPPPETIKEGKEKSPAHIGQEKIQLYPLARSKNTPVPVTKMSHRNRSVSPRTSPSTVPSLPSAARYAVSRTSSLERALDEVSQKLEKLEQEADKSTQLYSRPPTLVDKTNQKRHSPRRSNYYASGITPTRRPRLNEEILFVNRKMPPIKSPKSMPKKQSPSLPEPTREPPAPPPKQPTSHSSKEKTLPTIPQTGDILKDLDVFFDYEDANISDRDVIKGLQVAIHAAADNAYDSLIRTKTGLRIRRFLADLRAVGEMQDEDPVGRCAKE
ncbi:hypothetical protein F5Y00DRAFT_256618 [Daldinia vernicosa]|uniref:uncharacterized protein n=1 Tax=Daldinia vernicosa TaxID=114800 RepID=UPI0020083855|nr:uncharacterized protein F5Y00DRAFT_256618 [Daldinia vernicosa]KAI0854119.1 hypothetical protein F5Y00DRAFT_256618 [Daldinia vernicosa]